MYSKIKDIPNETIIQIVNEKGSMQKAAKVLGCSRQTVSYALKGRRKGPKTGGRVAGVKMCSCCGCAPVRKGNRWLCEVCWSGGEEDRSEDVYPCRVIGGGFFFGGR